MFPDIICGAGAVGCTLAYYLTHTSISVDSVEVIVIDEIDVAAAASGKAGGFLASDWCQGEDVDELCQLSFRLHQELAMKHDGAKRYGFRVVDAISCVVKSHPSSKKPKANLSKSDVVPNWIAENAVLKAHPMGSTNEKEVTMAQLYPRYFTTYMLEQAILSNKCSFNLGRVDDIDGTTVVLHDGRRLECDAVVIAMGPWTPSMLARHFDYPNISPPHVHKIHSVVIRNEQTPDWDPRVVFGLVANTEDELEIVPRANGTAYVCGSHVPQPLPANAASVHPDPSSVSQILRELSKFSGQHHSPSSVQLTNACYLPQTKDYSPIMGKLRDGVYVEKTIIDRKRNVLVLMLHYCMENGYLTTAEKLQQEAGVALTKFEVVDNIDLLRIVQEFEDFYEMKFAKKPKLVRRTTGDEEKSKGKPISSTQLKALVASQFNEKKAAIEKRQKRNNYSSPHMPTEARVENNAALKAVSNIIGATSQTKSTTEDVSSDIANLGLVGQKPAQRTIKQTKKTSDIKTEEDEESIEARLLKPLPFMHDGELRPLAETITREIFQKNPNVHWDNVVGLNDAKRLLKEAVVMPIKYPQLFKGLLSPWCGILLYGPPGNGKTMLAKAVATECKTTFFNISGSSIVSKYRGDSEKLVRMLFDLARYHAPSTIFLDEIDSIMGQRGESGGSQEHEASRRMKTELLIQMDGLAKSNEVVFVLAASNLPWELDAAMLRRLEKRVLVGLPSAEARHKMFQELLDPYIDSSFDFSDAVSQTESYSGADIKLVAKEACMAPVRRLMDKLEALETQATNNQVPHEPDDWQSLLDKICAADIRLALEKTKPSAHQFLRKYESWHSKFGSS
ncbi:katanin p60 ATPase-containing subunit A [Thraustotheca clavata]|uniref:Katanin p60 ATPase-containing subunit A-like 2 n=1 Tax=Thraustotheca clavata TaxID=74557 RepID=A0A1V9Z0D2_9STRA|nr:katanin p60 ATPase-containing subunit A [Thraustotheca clavata]